ncbi:MAG: FliI/YscN family ATPase [bacterium]|nr:FliI/YscN family ATPase [bacterium]
MSPFDRYRKVLSQVQPVSVTGQVVSVRGLTVAVGDFPAPVGAGCRIIRPDSGLDARVIGFSGELTLVMPLGSTVGICRGDAVECTDGQPSVPVGNEMLGRVVDGMARPIDTLGDLVTGTHMPLWPEPIPPMMRRRISEPLVTGVRAIDSMLTVGRGQRMGIFSPSGAGKSALMGMISRYCDADVVVIALIGERGREVRDFVEKELGCDGLKRSVVVASTSDQPPLVRVQAGAVATCIAEYFRDQGKNVVLVMDSLTRLATAQRQIGLVAGEPPTAGGYTPSVFGLLPELLERAGRTDTGSITGFYSVLTEGPDTAGPISDAVRSVADGHIVLSVEMANRGEFPAIDFLESISRVMGEVICSEHGEAVGKIRRLSALYREIEDMVNIGAYRKGNSRQFDSAIKAMPLLREFAAQNAFDNPEKQLTQTVEALADLCDRLDCDTDTLDTAGAYVPEMPIHG